MGFKKAFSKKLGAITRGFNYDGSSDFYLVNGAAFQAQISSTGLSGFQGNQAQISSTGLSGFSGLNTGVST